MHRIGEVIAGQGRFAEAGEVFRQAVQLAPDDPRAYFEWGLSYKFQWDYESAGKLFQKVVAMLPRCSQCIFELGEYYRFTVNWPQAEKYYLQALRLAPRQREYPYFYAGQEGWMYFTVGVHSLTHGRTALAEKLLLTAQKLSPADDSVHAALASLYKEKGDTQRSRECERTANRLRTRMSDSPTAKNYRKLKRILEERKIRLICVQYPMRRLEDLKNFFEGRAEGMIFVDNEKTFKEAVERGSYGQYFTDHFGGDFGHLTAQGNKLLAANIARVVLERTTRQ